MSAPLCHVAANAHSHAFLTHGKLVLPIACVMLRGAEPRSPGFTRKPDMTQFRFLLNPPAADLPRCSALLFGVARNYKVNNHRTTLSLKSVRRGAALYTTRRGRYLVTTDTFLILNLGQQYALEFEGLETTETLCPFFQPGFLEHAVTSRSTSIQRQLDELDNGQSSADFHEQLYPKTGRIDAILQALYEASRPGRACVSRVEDQFHELASALLELRVGVRAQIDQIPALRAATRDELYRRLHQGRDFVSSCFAQPITVAMAAQAAYLSPYHFHRMFKALFRQTPMQFLQERRLAAAARLLSNTDVSVTCICFAVGFESLGSFSWLFRKRFGCSPREFRGQRAAGRNSQD